VTSETEPSTIGGYLTAYRHKYQITQNDLAQILDTTQQSLSRWEAATHYPSIDKLFTISEALNIPFDTLHKLKPPTTPRRPPHPTPPPARTTGIIRNLRQLPQHSFTQLCWKLFKHQPHARETNPDITGCDLTYQHTDNITWHVHAFHRKGLNKFHLERQINKILADNTHHHLIVTTREYTEPFLNSLINRSGPRLRFMNVEDIANMIISTEAITDDNLAAFVRVEANKI